MSSQDCVRRFVFDNLNARGCLVSLDQTCVEIQQTHYYPPNLAQLLNEFAVAVTLLHDSIKVAANITIQLRTVNNTAGSAISLLMADSMAERKIRAIAEYDSELLGPDAVLDLTHLADSSTLAITITPHDGDRYQSIVPMEFATLAECLEDYFARSEQLPSWFNLMATHEHALGIAIHALPSQSGDKIRSDSEDQNAFERLRLLLNTLTREEAFELDAAQILTRLFHEESCRLFEPKSVEFGCVCSVQKSLEAIKSLGESDVAELIAEQRNKGNENVVVDCHFCFQRYEFSVEQLHELFA